MYRLVKIDFSAFIEKLEEFKSKEPKTYITSNIELEKQIDLWKGSVEKYLRTSISPIPSILIRVLNKEEYSPLFEIKEFLNRGDEKFMSQSLNERIDLIKGNIQAVIDYCQMCQTLNGDDLPDIASTQDRLDFVLEKLNIVNSDKYYSVKTIFELNSVQVRPEDPKEIALVLAKKDQVIKKDQYNGTNDKVKLTVKGSAYIERRLKSKAKVSQVRREKELDRKIDEVLENLRKLGYGQEIIFEEIEEMRGQVGKLSKKSWGQLLKGKLMDLAVAQVINKETAGDVFRFLTDTSLSLLK